MHSKRLAEFHFLSHSKELRQVRCSVRETLQRHGYTEAAIDDIVLALCEACANIIQHAYGKECAKEIILEIFHNDGYLVFRLRDFAAPVDVDCIKSRKLEELRPGGLGVHFIHQIMDEVVYAKCSEGKGNVLEMKKKIVPSRGTG